MRPLPRHLLMATPANSPSIQTQIKPVLSTSSEEAVTLKMDKFIN